MRSIPNIVTLLNLVFGLFAIIFALQSEVIVIQQYGAPFSQFNFPEQMAWAAICIFIAALIDFFDGFIARLFHATSAIGKQLDSLCDVVSFGVAPSIIFYQLLRLGYAQQPESFQTAFIFLAPAVILACAAAYRLARFNISSNQQRSFKGVPVPAVGIVAASFPLIRHFTEVPGFRNLLITPWFLYIVIAVLSYLMVSPLRMYALKFSGSNLTAQGPLLLLAVIAIICAIFLGWAAIPVVFICYVIISILFQKSIK